MTSTSSIGPSSAPFSLFSSFSKWEVLGFAVAIIASLGCLATGLAAFGGHQGWWSAGVLNMGQPLSIILMVVGGGGIGSVVAVMLVVRRSPISQETLQPQKVEAHPVVQEITDLPSTVPFDSSCFFYTQLNRYDRTELSQNGKIPLLHEVIIASLAKEGVPAHLGTFVPHELGKPWFCFYEVAQRVAEDVLYTDAYKKWAVTAGNCVWIFLIDQARQDQGFFKASFKMSNYTGFGGHAQSLVWNYECQSECLTEEEKIKRGLNSLYVQTYRLLNPDQCAREIQEALTHFPYSEKA